MAGSLAHGMEIFRLARENRVPCWSSSSLRFCPNISGLKNSDQTGAVLGCAAYCPCWLEEHHPDLYWYGIHGVEILFTLMGTGCVSVQRIPVKEGEFVVGTWEDGRIGTFRGLREGKTDYGAFVYGEKGIARTGPYSGYGPLVNEIVKFFKTGKVPVPPEETIEILAFMTAADESKRRGGSVVTLVSVMETARKKIN
jgi:hypothetical protein